MYKRMKCIKYSARGTNRERAELKKKKNPFTAETHPHFYSGGNCLWIKWICPQYIVALHLLISPVRSLWAVNGLWILRWLEEGVLGVWAGIGLPPVPLSIKLSQVILMNLKYRLRQTGKSLGLMCAHGDTEELRSLKSLVVVFVSICKHK